MSSGCDDAVRHVYIIGAKGISQYGGFESFVQNLLEHSRDFEDIAYHVACKANGKGAMDLDALMGVSKIKDNRYTYCGADCFFVKVPSYLGSAQAIFYDIISLKSAYLHIEENNIANPVICILGCSIGPLFRSHVKRIHGHGGKICINPDGHEWARRKWPKWVRRYLKLSERLMVKYADLVICDNEQIEDYIREEYRKYKPETTYIPYGSDVTPSKLSDDDYRFKDWLELAGTTPRQYYLVVGRFVAENNFDLIMKEFMKTDTDKKLIVITTVNEKLKNRLKKELDYSKDKRIVLAAPVYDTELLKKIREQAYAYIHGHEVGGTNPSLLEGLASSKLNLVLGVKFNKEVAGDTALYWDKAEGNLTELINKAEGLDENVRLKLGIAATERVHEKYDWDDVARKYLALSYGRM